MKAVFVLCILILSQSVFANFLHEFETDGCSSPAFSGTSYHENSWVHCCVIHDLAYYGGGTEEERSDADGALQACVKQVAENIYGLCRSESEFTRCECDDEYRFTKYYATQMKWAVKIGGSPMWKRSVSWGFGWDEDRPYVILTEDDKFSISSKLLMVHPYKIEINTVQSNYQL